MNESYKGLSNDEQLIVRVDGFHLCDHVFCKVVVRTQVFQNHLQIYWQGRNQLIFSGKEKDFSE